MQMHFDTMRSFIVSGQVTKITKVKVRAQFTVQAREQIQIECRGDPQRIVVSQLHHRRRLHQVRADQQRIAGSQNAPHVAQELLRGLAVEIPDGAAQKKNE